MDDGTAPTERAVSSHRLFFEYEKTTRHSLTTSHKSSSYTAEIKWDRAGSVFTDNRYSRAHRWEFDGGAVVAASSSPHVVRVPWSDPANVDPEEALVAALSSCHMLFFLGYAAREKFVVDSYTDLAEGVMGTADDGRMAMTFVTLKPVVTFSGPKIPQDVEIEALHHEAHENCYIANSVRTEIKIQHTWKCVP